MFLELWKQVPFGFKILWVVGVLLGAGLTGLICTLWIQSIKFLMRH